MASWLPTDEQKEQWERFTEASRESAEATSDLSGKQRMKARAAFMSRHMRMTIDEKFNDDG